MSQQTVNVGSVANDGTGDTPRAAFIKCNSNFSELYTLVNSFSAANANIDTTDPSNITQNSTHRFVTDTQISTWNAKQDGSIDLSAIAGLSPTDNDILQRKSGGWINRSISELKVDLSLSGTNTGDQTTVSGNSGTTTKLATSRAIDGQSFDGSADITVIAPGTHAATGKTTPVDADEVPIVDSAASNVLKKLTWSNLKATLKTYFDTIYQATIAGLSSDANKVAADRDFQVPLSNAINLGDRATDGSWRLIQSGNDLVVQRRESGSWVTKFTIAA